MRGLGLVLTFCFIVFVAQLGAWSQIPDADLAEKNVLRTAFWTLTFSGLVTSICAITTHNLGTADPGSEMVVCLPFSVPTAAITIRAHIFAVGGYGRQEWIYIQSIPSRTRNFLWEKSLDTWRIVEDELCRLGVVKS